MCFLDFCVAEYKTESNFREVFITFAYFHLHGRENIDKFISNFLWTPLIVILDYIHSFGFR